MFSRRKNSYYQGAHFVSDELKTPATVPVPTEQSVLRLIKYLAQAGICSRRKAELYIRDGLVKVNDAVCKDPWRAIEKSDKVTCENKPAVIGKKVYIVLNKPKDCICTAEDPEGRRTVFDLIKYPPANRASLHTVGRLDRDSTGLIILTNDGDLTQLLAHPKNGIRKRYVVSLNQQLTSEHAQMALNGVQLEDGLSNFDNIRQLGVKGRTFVYSVELHSGKNRVIRRVFKRLGYFVLDLDRVSISSITKRDLPVTRWRFLTAGEVAFLKKKTQPVVQTPIQSS